MGLNYSAKAKQLEELNHKKTDFLFKLYYDRLASGFKVGYHKVVSGPWTRMAIDQDKQQLPNRVIFLSSCQSQSSTGPPWGYQRWRRCCWNHWGRLRLCCRLHIWFSSRIFYWWYPFSLLVWYGWELQWSFRLAWSFYLSLRSESPFHVGSSPRFQTGRCFP